MANLNINDQKGKGLYAQAKNSADAQFEHERENLKSSSIIAGATKDFANPLKNARKLGITEGMQVADLGSGSGHYVLAMANLVGSSGKVYAVDIQKDLLSNIQNEATKRGYNNIEIIWGDLEQVGGSKIADNILDLTLISNTLFQVEKKEVLLHEAYRIIKPSGSLAIIDWSQSHGGIGPITSDIVSKDVAIDMAISAGFTTESEFDAGVHHYGIIFKK